MSHCLQRSFHRTNLLLQFEPPRALHHLEFSQFLAPISKIKQAARRQTASGPQLQKLKLSLVQRVRPGSFKALSAAKPKPLLP